MDYNILILKKIAGQTSEQEKRLLEEWKNSNPENSARFEEIKFIWEKSESDSGPLSGDEFKEELLKLEHSINTSISLENKMSRFERRGKYKSAAIIALGLASVSLLASNELKPTESGAFRVYRQEHSTEIVLADSSRIILNDSSNVTISGTGKSSAISVSGEALLDVRKRKEPLSITSGEATILIDSAEILIRNRPQDIVEVFVLSGMPAVVISGERINVSPGEQIHLNKHAVTVSRSVASDANIKSWYTRRLQFNAVTLREVLEKISAVYHVQFLAPSERFMNCPFTGTFEKTSLDNVLRILSYSMDIKFSHVRTNQYTVSGRGCLH